MIKEETTGVEDLEVHRVKEWDELLRFANKEVAGRKVSPLYKCSLCAKTLKKSSRNRIKEHIENKHFKGVFTHHCSLCNEVFVTKSQLRRHTKDAHRG